MTSAPLTLLLMRHAKAADAAPGQPDRDRPLNSKGQRQAISIGSWLDDAGLLPDQVMCSPSVRTQETVAQLGLPVPPTLADGLWDASAEDVAAVVGEAPDDVRVLLVVAHAPGLPSLAADLTDRDASDPAALAELDRHFPTGAVAHLELAGPWSALSPGRLVALVPPA